MGLSRWRLTAIPAGLPHARRGRVEGLKVKDFVGSLRIWDFTVAFVRLIGGCFPPSRLRLTWGQDNPETAAIPQEVRGCRVAPR